MAPLEPPAPDSVDLARRARGNMIPLVLGQAISLFGDQVAIFSLAWMVVELTGRERDLGLTAAAETLPMLLFGIAAGVLIDRVAVRGWLIAADLLRAAAFLLLALAVTLDVEAIWMVFAVAFLAGTMAVFFDSGFQALMPSALTDELLVPTNTRLQFAATLATVIGPSIAGLLIAGAGGLSAAFVVNAITFGASAVYLVRVRVVRPRPPAGDARFGQELRAGLAYLWREPRLRWATLGASAANLAFAPVAATLILYANELLGLGSRGAGLFFAANAAIGAAAVLAAGRVIARLRLGRTMVVGMVMLGGGFVVVAATTTFVLAVAAAGTALAGVAWINVAFTTLRQAVAPPEFLGRVVAASRAISWTGIPVGAAFGGLVADAIGLVPLYRICSVGVIVVALGLAATPLWRDPVAAP